MIDLSKQDLIKGFKQVFVVDRGDEILLVHQCENLDGYPVTIAVCVGLEKEKQQFLLSWRTAITVCSKEEIFDSQLGIDIALGRLIQKDNSDVTMIMTSIDIPFIFKGLQLFLSKKVDKIKDFISIKKELTSYVNNITNMKNSVLKELFGDIK